MSWGPISPRVTLSIHDTSGSAAYILWDRGLHRGMKNITGRISRCVACRTCLRNDIGQGQMESAALSKVLISRSTRYVSSKVALAAIQASTSCQPTLMRCQSFDHILTKSAEDAYDGQFMMAARLFGLSPW